MKMTLDEFCVFLIFLAFMFTVVYLLGAYVAADWNMFAWSPKGRVAFAVVLFVSLFMSREIAKIDAKESNKNRSEKNVE